MCEYEFVPSSPDALDALKDEVICFMGSLERNGQICGDEVVGVVGGAVRAVVMVPRPDALEDRHGSPWVRAARARVRSQCARSPSWRVVDDGARAARYVDWRESASLYLFTHMFDRTSPVCSGSDGAPVPLYLTGLSPETRSEIVAWAAQYRLLDELQLGCGALEIPAYRELASPTSELAREGRALCSAIEAAEGKPTYYYLLRYWGREQDEESRPCPGCGGAWAVAASRSGGGLAWFDFRCQPCRLVSHRATSFESPEHAQIGEWHGG